MKTLLSLCFILFFVSSNSAARQYHPRVIDTDGEELRVGSKYYVASARRGSGGLTLSYYPNLTCPVTVSQESSEGQQGMPVSFHPADRYQNRISVSESLNVKFETPVPCSDSTVWKVGSFDPNTQSRLIQIEGVQGNPGCDTAENWFKIELGDITSSYKFVSSAKDVCSNEGDSYPLNAEQVNGQTSMPLVQSFGQALDVVFIKYEEGYGVKQGRPFIAMLLNRI